MVGESPVLLVACPVSIVSTDLRLALIPSRSPVVRDWARTSSAEVSYCVCACVAQLPVHCSLDKARPLPQQPRLISCGSCLSVSIRFATPELGQRAITEMQNYQIDSRPIQVRAVFFRMYISIVRIYSTSAASSIVPFAR